MMKFSPYMILIGGVDDYTLNLNQDCCLGNINSTTMDMTTAFKQRGMIAFGPKGNSYGRQILISINIYTQGTKKSLDTLQKI